MLYKNEKVLFQSKVDCMLLQRFRELQLEQGRTTRFMLEKWMQTEIENYNDKNRRISNVWSRKVI